MERISGLPVAPKKLLVEINENWTEIDGQRMRFLQAGSGPPLLLVHGLLGGSFCWRFTLPVLAQRYNVYAVDLPGTSLTDDVGVDCSMSRQAERLHSFIKLMGWDALSVLGTSFGGAVALLLAGLDAQGAGKIRSLVLSSPVNPWSDFGQRRIRRLSSRLGGAFLRLVLPISHPVHRIAVRRMFGDPARIPPDTVAGYRASVLQPGRAQNVLTALRKWQADVECLRRVIPQVKVPVLLIWGTSDKAVDLRSATTLQQHLPNAEVKLIAGAGHLPFEEEPEEFNRLAMEFLVRDWSSDHPVADHPRY